MKPYGREKKIGHFQGKRNLTFPNTDWINWWEGEFDTIIERPSLKQKIKKTNRRGIK